jgi:UDP-N-acetylglucosamine diphosphorylase / glucose-1-phosphate thymidylyltransferase / UDP-N-acetylgalactosamine diphosphorylase / glucosamine-1-phosphate N-acetyltransferase / galactosamine-1-phosphate N-acetyltransferase
VAIETAIVLAAGGGERMWPYNEVRNKCALPVGGAPNVRLLVDALADAGVRRAVVVVGPHAGSVRAALLGAPIAIAYAEQAHPRGTADAVLAGLRLVDDNAFLIVYGDIYLTTASLAAVGAAWDNGNAAAVALVEQLQAPRRPQDWIGAFVEADMLRGVEGHSRDADYRWCGVVAGDRRLLPYLEANPGFMSAVPVGGMPAAEAELAESLQRFLDDGNPVATVTARGPFVDLDKPWHILEANHQRAAAMAASITEHRIHPTARVHDGAELRGNLVLGPGSVIGNRVIVGGNLVVGAQTEVINGAILHGPAVIGDRCRVSDYCLVGAHAAIGSRCVVGHGAEISGVQFDGSYLWHYCEIYGVVGQSVDIGAATVCGTLRFDDGTAEHRVRGRREIPEWGGNATFFGDFSRTGVNVITQPGVKIGTYACVGAGVVLYDDLPSRTLRLLKPQETIDRPWGPERYGW